MTDRNLTIPNILTVGRMALAPLIGVLIIRQEFGGALWVLLGAGLTDFLDGFIAKRFNQKSYLGAVLDPVADKLLMVVTVLSLARIGLLPLWITLPVLLRDFVIFLGAVAYYKRAGSINIRPTILSKANTCAQIGVLLLVIALHGGILPAFWLLTPAFLLVLTTTVSSGVQYVLIWRRKAAEIQR